MTSVRPNGSSFAPPIPVPQSYDRPREYGLREIVNATFYVKWLFLEDASPRFSSVGNRVSLFSALEQEWGLRADEDAQLRGDLRERLDAPEKPVRASLTRNRSRSPTAVGSMAMMGQKNKRSQAAYPRRYLGTSAENQGSRSEHHGSGRSETICSNSKEHSKVKLVWADMGYSGVDFATWVEKEIGWKMQTIKGPRKWIRSHNDEKPPCHRGPEALQSSPGAGIRF